MSLPSPALYEAAFHLVQVATKRKPTLLAALVLRALDAAAIGARMMDDPELVDALCAVSERVRADYSVGPS